MPDFSALLVVRLVSSGGYLGEDKNIAYFRRFDFNIDASKRYYLADQYIGF
ncbi:MAG: hypothetical protein ACTSWY_00535 [Promethearchaeota archaeon]